MPDIDEATSAAVLAELTGGDSPTPEQTAEEPSAEDTTPDAEDTGEGDLTVGEEEDESAPGPVPYSRFREVNEKAKTFQTKAEQFDQLISNPRVIQALGAADTQPSPVPETPDDPLAILDQTDFAVPEEGTAVRAIAQAVREVQAENARLREELTGVRQYTQTSQQQAAMNEFNSTVAAMEAQAGFKLTEDQRQQLLKKASLLGAEQGVTMADIVAVPFESFAYRNLISKQKANTHAARVQGEKRTIAANSVGGVPVHASLDNLDVTGIDDRDISFKGYDKLIAE